MRPSVTSSGRIFKNSSTQSPALLPNADPTVANTSFHATIWMAKLARHTQSWVWMGRGPDAKATSRPSTESRKATTDSGGSWSKSKTICAGQSAIQDLSQNIPYLSFECGGREQFGLDGDIGGL